MNIDQLTRKFLKECDVNLQLIHRGIDAAGSEETRTDALQDIFRGAHSIKGGSGFFGLDRVGRLAAAIEDVCAKLVSGTLAFSDEISVELTNGARFLADLTEAAEIGIVLVEGYELAILDRLNDLVRRNRV